MNRGPCVYELYHLNAMSIGMLRTATVISPNALDVDGNFTPYRRASTRGMSEWFTQNVSAQKAATVIPPTTVAMSPFGWTPKGSNFPDTASTASAVSRNIGVQTRGIILFSAAKNSSHLLSVVMITPLLLLQEVGGLPFRS